MHHFLLASWCHRSSPAVTLFWSERYKIPLVIDLLSRYSDSSLESVVDYCIILLAHFSSKGSKHIPGIILPLVGVVIMCAA
jgi:hypothetical protein